MSTEQLKPDSIESNFETIDTNALDLIDCDGKVIDVDLNHKPIESNESKTIDCKIITTSTETSVDSAKASTVAASSWWWTWPGQWISDHAEQMTIRFLQSVHVQLNGSRPFDLQVRRRHAHISLAKYVLGIDRFGFGDSFVNGDWDCDDLFGLLSRCCESQLLFCQGFHLVARLMHSGPLLYLNRHSRSLSRSAIAAHYDIGNDLFQAMLDPTLNYSCGYWARPSRLTDCNQLSIGGDESIHGASKTRRYSDEAPLYAYDIALVEQQMKNHHSSLLTLTEDPIASRTTLNADRTSQSIKLARSLHEAQLNKMLMIGRKLKLSPGMRVLDIGCGWGSLAKFLALHFQVHVLAVTISKEQIEYAQAHSNDFVGICCTRKECDCSLDFQGLCD
jgi:hypothetical protein